MPDARAAAARFSVHAVNLLGSILLDEQASRQQRERAAIVLLRVSGRYAAPSEEEQQVGRESAQHALHARAARLNRQFNARD